MKSIYSNTIMSIIHILSVAAIYLLLNTGCDLLESNKSSNNLQLTVSETSCTEAWLSLKTNQLPLPQEISLIQNEKERETFNLTKRDTLLYLDSLQPNKSYKFKVKPRQGTVTSQTVIANTMDTTSHNFSWETFTIGDEGQGTTINDVAIINENNIWTVGEIHTNDTYTYDSNGVWQQPYNAVHWDGESWELKRILFSYHGSMIYSPLRSLLAFSEDDIWLEAGIHWNGEEFETVPFSIDFPSHVYSSWGTSSENFYIAGNDGNIAHYDGNSWEKIESGADLDIQDISGYKDAHSEKIYCIGAELFSGIKSELYKIENNEAIVQRGVDLGIEALSLWTYSKKLYVAGGRNFVKTEGNDQWEEIPGSKAGEGLYKIRGTNYNDIVTVGTYYDLYHFNGNTWKRSDITIEGGVGTFYSVDIKGDIICAVGRNLDSRTGIIVIGKR